MRQVIGTTAWCVALLLIWSSQTAAKNTQPGSRFKHPLPSEWAEWPVPATSPVEDSYILSRDIVVDKVTGLTWQRGHSREQFTWPEAQAYCANLRLGNYRHWRLPSEMELLTLVDYGRYNPAINLAAFPDTPYKRQDGYGWFWSLSPDASNSENLMTVDFAYGYIVSFRSSIANWARCVR